MPHYFATIILVVASGLWIARYLRNTVSPSFSAIPNAHFTAPYSRFWLRWIKLTGREHHARNAAHKRLGSVIRIAPQELSVNCIKDGVQTIYSSAFEKTIWYSGFKNYGQSFMFSMAANKPHSERKRMLAHVYSKTHIQNSMTLNSILDTMLLKRFIPQMREWAKEGCVVNVNLENKALFMDVITAYLFGLENGTNFIQNPEEKVLLRKFESFTYGLFWASEFPGLLVSINRLRESILGDLVRYYRVTERLGLTNLIHQLRIPVLADTARCYKSVETFVLDLCQRAKDRMSPSAMGHSSHLTVYSSFRERLEESQTVPSDLLDVTIAGELLDEIQAAHEPTGITLAFLMWELSRHPEACARLQRELDTLGTVRSAQAIDNLPFTDALLKETMRLYPAGLGPFPRCVPEKGAVVDGFDLAPGTIVSSSAYALHRHPGVFPEPENWTPSRWIDATAERKNEMAKWFWAFGSGSRMCIGSHLASRIIKAALVAIYSEYDTFTANSNKVQQIDSLIGTPVDNEIMLRVAKRAQT
ncbi:uncharacterized protein BP5553_09463 [Venustampulla echinocandica]|uniref:Cytochrome P450 n=1 Tax=Venustampulla echinocandica TaxID=2656787 RepID=A0A370TCW2_9HELO|nr:uncharacterized protein BP5553_09463 [Venustampulla echinocandica]RDL32061.1 hypothetical protein BP5553_09463 [Venustampulla echinocandica]